MTKKILLTALLLLPLIAMSGAAYAGGGRLSTVFQNSAQPQKQTGRVVASKPYAQYVAPRQTSPWTFRGSATKSPRFVGQ